MNYSRRQLEAFGEPLGESATRTKAGGFGRIYGGGGGGGGSAPANTTQTTTAELPEWARPYAKDVLAKGQALTDVSQNPYQIYGQPRVAGFSPLQQQAQEAAGKLGPTQQTAEASDLASAAGRGALGAQYQAGRFSGGMFSPYAASAYMSPFIEQAMQPQLREAQRSSDILGTQQRGQATQMGAFGGSRQALMEAERQRNLGTQLGDIRAKGYQTAYEQAQNQFNQDMQRRMQAQQLGEQSRQFGANIGMQGLQTGLQAAGTLGTLGQQQFGQQQQAIDAQSRMGAQQQALRQQGLDMAYQDFMAQQNYPYKQLGYMSDLVRGLPLGQQSTAQIYQGAPTTMQSLTGLGLGAYGLSKLAGAKEGGLMESFAEGGLSVVDKFNDPEEMLAEMDKLTDAQLQAIIKSPTTPAEAEAAKRELAMRASERQGLAGAFNQMPQEQQQAMVRAAGGGIIAFAKPDASNNYSLVRSEDGISGGDDDGPIPGSLSLEDLAYSRGDPALYGHALRRALTLGEQIGEFEPRTMSDEDYNKAIEKRYSLLQRLGGESPFAGFEKSLADRETRRAKAREEGKGLAALAAIPEVMQPGGTLRALGRGLGAFGGAMGKVAEADRAERSAIENLQFNIADAQRKERMGLGREAITAADQARRDVSDLNRAHIQKLQAQATAAGRVAQAAKPTGRPPGSGEAKMPQVDRQAAAISDQIAAIELANPDDKRLPLLRKQLEGRLKIIGTGKDVGPTRAGLMEGQTFQRASAEVQKLVKAQALMDPKWQEAFAANDDAGMAAALDRLTTAQMTRQGVASPGASPGGAARIPPPPPGFNPVNPR